MAEAIVFDTMMRKASIISNRRDSIANSLIHDTHSMIDVQKNVKSESINLNNAIEGSVYIVSVRSGSVNAGFVDDNPEEELSKDCGLYHNGSGSKEQLDINGDSDNISLVVIGALQEPRNGWPFTNQEIESIEQKIRSNSIQIKKNDKTLPESKVEPSVCEELSARDYLVAFSAFCITLITYGNMSALSVYVIEWLADFPDSEAEVLYIPSLARALMSSAGIVNGFLIHYFGLSQIIFLGGFLQSICLIGSFFSQDSLTLIFFLGLLLGFGACFCYVNCFVLMGLQFGKSSKSFISILSLAGPLSGVLPNLIIVLFELYSWRGSLLIMAGINLQIFPLALFIFLSQKHKDDKALKNEKSLNSKKPLDWSLLKNLLYIAYVCAVAFTSTALNASYSLLAAFLNKKGLTLNEATVIYGLYNIICATPRALFGIFERWITFPFVYIYIVLAILTGLVFILITQVNSYTGLFSMCVILSLCMGGPSGLYPVGVLQIVGSEQYSLGLSIVETSYGIGTAFFGYLAGLLIAETDSYVETFCIYGSLAIAANIYLLITSIFIYNRNRNCHQSKKKCELS